MNFIEKVVANIKGLFIPPPAKLETQQYHNLNININ